MRSAVGRSSRAKLGVRVIILKCTQEGFEVSDVEQQRQTPGHVVRKTLACVDPENGGANALDRSSL